MKKYIILLALVLYGCTKQPIEPISNDIKLSFDYTLPVKSGDMTTKGSSLSYINFYNKYIATKILTPKTYNLNFINLDNNFRYGASGIWEAHDLISIPAGRYHVIGDSRADEDCSDICSFLFNDTITISSATITLQLKAKYACSLILLDTTNIGWTQFSTTHPNTAVIADGMMKTDDLFHSFISDQVNGSNYINYSIDLWISKRAVNGAAGGTGMSISITSFKWETGKYYYIENTGNTYVIPMMINK
jgi:hypothetical protein